MACSNDSVQARGVSLLLRSGPGLWANGTEQDPRLRNLAAVGFSTPLKPPTAGLVIDHVYHTPAGPGT